MIRESGGQHAGSVAVPAAGDHRTRRAILAVLIAAYLLQTTLASLQKSPTSDETVHLTAGLSYIQTGHIVVNQEHPPLLKEISGLFLRIAGVRWPPSTDATALAAGDLSREPAVSYSILSGNGPDKVMFWARLPFILEGAIYACIFYLFGRELLGGAAALGSVFLYAFDPNIIAHSAFVTTDVGMAGLSILFLLALWRYCRRPNWRHVVFAGLALGAALCAKFSAVALLPIMGVLLLAAAIWPVELPDSTSSGPVVTKGDARAAGGRKHKKVKGVPGAPAQTPGPTTRVLQYAAGAVGMCLIAVMVIQAVYLFSADPFQYLAGYKLVGANHQPDFKAYMAGQLQHRFYSYYLIAYLLKEPLASIVLALTGGILLLTSGTISRLKLAFLLVPSVVFCIGYTLLSDDLGFRYIIPVLPFAYLAGGAALAKLWSGPGVWTRAAAIVLSLWVVLAAAGIYPDHLSYFNEAACLPDRPSQIGFDGGARCGTSWLGDSNVDWGQGLKQLRSWIDRNAQGQTLHLGYFGPFPPEGYGIKYEPMLDEDYVSPRQPGIYIVSAFLAAPMPYVIKEKLGAGGEWLRHPRLIVAHAFHVYEVGGSPAPGNH